MSYNLSIKNDTPNTWQCQVGGTKRATLEILTLISSVIDSIIGAIVTAGAAVPFIFASAMANGGESIFGLNTEAAIAVTESAGAIAGTAGFARTAVGVLASVVAFSRMHFESLGYTTIPPGRIHHFGQHSLSPRQQGHCIRHRSFPERNLTYVVDELYMLPSLLGATDNSNVDLSIKLWYNTFGPENALTFQVAPPDGKASWGDVNALLVVNAPTATPPLGTSTPTVTPTTSTSAPTVASLATFSDAPSQVPSGYPSFLAVVPVATGSDAPSLVPSIKLSDAPSQVPSRFPSLAIVSGATGSDAPSLVPSIVPSTATFPTAVLQSDAPSLAPTTTPSKNSPPSLLPFVLPFVVTTLGGGAIDPSSLSAGGSSVAKSSSKTSAPTLSRFGGSSSMPVFSRKSKDGRMHNV